MKRVEVSMFRLSWSQALFTRGTLDAGLTQLARLGYDGVELPFMGADPAKVSARRDHHGLACFSVDGSFVSADRDLSSSDASLRRVAVNRSKTYRLGTARRSVEAAASEKLVVMAGSSTWTSRIRT